MTSEINRRERPIRRWAAAAATLFAGLLLVQCATNPATGERQLMLVSEAQEIALGREADQDIVNQYGLYGDQELQTYVQNLGMELARESERPDLDWTFRLLDDPVVNAFALPGGYIYVTRGIMAHLGSEAELAGVIGHEIGHVTGRHTANRMSKAQLAGVGLLVGAIAAPEVAEAVGGLAETSLQLLFLKYSRDDERQADELGFRYMTQGGYPPAALGEVFTVLSRVGESAGGGQLPNWLATHPNPENRRTLVEQRLGSVPAEVAQASWHRDDYLDRLEGVVFGPDPRQGYFEGSAFYHPALAFKIDFPAGWETQNTRSAVAAAAQSNGRTEAIMVLQLADKPSVAEAERAFFSSSSIAGGGRWLDAQRGLLSDSRTFRALSNNVTLQGGVAFAEYGDQVYQLLGYTTETAWSTYGPAMERAALTFTRLTDRSKLDVQPMRVEVVKLDRAMTLEEFDRRYPSAVDLEQLAIINHTEASAQLAAGTLVKRVEGFNPER